ncbi:MAG: hypothetical protein ACK587_16875 [Cyanobacteriota bacterium]
MVAVCDGGSGDGGRGRRPWFWRWLGFGSGLGGARQHLPRGLLPSPLGQGLHRAPAAAIAAHLFPGHPRLQRGPFVLGGGVDGGSHPIQRLDRLQRLQGSGGRHTRRRLHGGCGRGRSRLWRRTPPPAPANTTPGRGPLSAPSHALPKGSEAGILFPRGELRLLASGASSRLGLLLGPLLLPLGAGLLRHAAGIGLVLARFGGLPGSLGSLGIAGGCRHPALRLPSSHRRWRGVLRGASLRRSAGLRRASVRPSAGLRCRRLPSGGDLGIAFRRDRRVFLRSWRCRPLHALFRSLPGLRLCAIGWSRFVGGFRSGLVGDSSSRSTAC